MQYDDIIVGAGSSGAVLAARLSEDPNRSVLLLEAGPDYPAISQRPDDLLHSFASVGPHDWGFTAEATPGRNIPYPRGKVTGGCSAINATMALRGVPQDFDEWAAWGNDEWSFANVLPFYRKLENDLDFKGDFHGTNGPISIGRARREAWQPLGEAFYQACRAAGFAEVADHNDPAATGIGPSPLNRRDGVRVSTAIGYLDPARHRINLTIRPEANVHRIIIENGQATGVEAECGGIKQHIRGRRITLSAGALNSPAILLRSGIGPRRQLEALGIRCLADLAGVGENLIDHPVVFLAVKPIADIEHDHAVRLPLIVRYTSRDSSEFNDMQICTAFLFDESLIPGLAWPIAPPIARFGPVLQRPRSRGRLRLTTADPDVPAVIQINFVSDPEDLRRLVDGMRIVWRMLNGRDLNPYIEEVFGPAQEIVDSDSGLAAFIRENCTTIFHPVGTAKMGPESDPMAVVDQYCRVRGIDGLRVVDASVMPNIVRANTNLTCIMIGERVADWMRESD